jgi:CheY-like chemotaxis protein
MAQAHPPARQVVLIVEDEPLIRMMAVDVIEEAGFHALEAGNADEAVLILETRTDIGIVFTDIDMPGSMNGLKLAAAVRDRWPPIQIIVTSGQVRVRDQDMPPHSQFFAKPYETSRLVRALKEIIHPA